MSKRGLWFDAGTGWGRGSTYSQQGKGVGMKLGKSVCVCV